MVYLYLIGVYYEIALIIKIDTALIIEESMMKSSHWGESSIHASSKKVHKAPVISISIRDRNLFYTSSEDNTVRLWDGRIRSSVKLFRNQLLNSLTNCENDRENLVFVASAQNVYAFDARKEDIFVEQILKKTEQAHFDEVSVIKFNNSDSTLGVGDDEGDIRLYNSDLQCTGLLDQGHSNIINAIEFVNTQQGSFCITGGYDCKLIHWKIDDQKIVRELDLQQLLKKYEIKATTIPFIHSISLHKTALYVTTESGHVLSFPVKDLKKPKYILEASLSRVVQSRIAEFNQNLLVTLARDGSFSLFDHTKRMAGVPLFLQKYKCHDEPNWMEIMGNEILISSNSTSELGFFTVK